MVTAPKSTLKSPRRATDKRTTGTPKNPKVVKSPSAASYKMVTAPQVAKGKVGRPKKVK